MNSLSVPLHTRRMGAGGIDKCPIEQDIRHDRAPRRRHLRALPPLLRVPAKLQREHERPRPAARRGLRRARDNRADARRGGDAHWRGHRSRHRVVPQRSLARIQDRRRHRSGVVGTVPPARGLARRDGRDHVADGRARGRRRAGVGCAPAAADTRVERVCIWTPDKDLAQCVTGDRVVQMDRRSGQMRDESGVRAKFGVAPAFIPDYLALVGDAADGYPGIPGIGSKTAARLIAQHGHLEQFPASLLGERRENALLFKTLATLRTDAPLFDDVDSLRWKGPTQAFPSSIERLGNPRLAERVQLAIAFSGFRCCSAPHRRIAKIFRFCSPRSWAYTRLDDAELSPRPCRPAVDHGSCS